MTLKTVETGVNRHLSKSPKPLYNIYIWLICIYMTSEESMKWHRWNIQKYFLYLAYMFSVVFKNRERPPPSPSYTLTSQKWQQVTHHFLPELFSSILGDFFYARVTICRYFTKCRICQSKAFLHTPPAWITQNNSNIKIQPPLSQIKQKKKKTMFTRYEDWISQTMTIMWNLYLNKHINESMS